MKMTPLPTLIIIVQHFRLIFSCADGPIIWFSQPHDCLKIIGMGGGCHHCHALAYIGIAVCHGLQVSQCSGGTAEWHRRVDECGWREASVALCTLICWHLWESCVKHYIHDKKIHIDYIQNLYVRWKNSNIFICFYLKLDVNSLIVNKTFYWMEQ